MAPELNERQREHIAAAVRSVQDRIAQACERVDRDPATVTLVAISKKKPVEMIEAAAAAGVTTIGENYVQEALPKIESCKADVSWHFTGHLQRNKVKQVVGRFDLIHTLDSERLAREIDKRAAAAQIAPVATLIEINLAGEESKTGIDEEALDALLSSVETLAHVEVRGLMTMPPPGEPEAARPYFQQLARIARERELPELSMGMTSDFEIAVEEGATLVRVGTAIFGAREENFGERT